MGYYFCLANLARPSSVEEQRYLPHYTAWPFFIPAKEKAIMKLLILLANIPVPVLLGLVFCTFLLLLLLLLLVACSKQATDRIIQVLDALSDLYYYRYTTRARQRGRKHIRRHGGE